jgi:serine/threonine-protein kinase
VTRWGIALAYAALALVVALLGGYLAVSLVVERGEEVEVPAVLGLSLSEALDRLSDRGLDLEVRAFVYSDAVPENRIVRQSPTDGNIVKAGRSVGVTLSRGPERHAVPDLRGMLLEDARIRLGEAGLVARVAARIHRGPESEVVAQGITPGRRVATGAEVPLILSAGPPRQLLRMPRLEGMSLDDALSELDAWGLRVARVEEIKLEDTARNGRVISHEPLPGFPVERGEAVTVSVAGSARASAYWRDLWVVRTFAPGFARRQVEVALVRGEREWVLADEWVGGGQTFRRWVPVRPGESIRVRIDGEDQGEAATATREIP